MSQPPLPPPPPSLPLPNSSPRPADMTETQKLPVFSPPAFLDYPHRRLPPLDQLKPLEIPPNAVPPRPDHPFRSPINQLPSIHPPRPHDYHHHPPHAPHPAPAHRPAAPVDKLLHHANSYTPPRSSDPPYSPQQYPPPISPRSEYDSRGPPRRLAEQRYSYDEPRHIQHHANHEPPYSSLASPVDSSHQRSYAPLPSPGYTPSYASSSTPFRGSVGSLQHSQRGSIAAPLGLVNYPEPPTAAAAAAAAVAVVAAPPPPRKQTRVIPLPGSIPQPVYNEQL